MTERGPHNLQPYTLHPTPYTPPLTLYTRTPKPSEPEKSHRRGAGGMPAPQRRRRRRRRRRRPCLRAMRSYHGTEAYARARGHSWRQTRRGQGLQLPAPLLIHTCHSPGRLGHEHTWYTPPIGTSHTHLLPYSLTHRRRFQRGVRRAAGGRVGAGRSTLLPTLTVWRPPGLGCRV